MTSPFGRRGTAHYLRAVHYFGRTQPLNFWDSAVLAEAPAHLAQIRRDGFDAVIIVVPWRGFQRTVVPSTFDEVNLGRLRQLLAMVQDAGLRFILRVSYPFNSDPESVGDFDERVVGLFSRREVREGWLTYLREVRRIAEAFAGFRFAFFSWEDFPSIRELMVFKTPTERLALAQSLGFRSYLGERFDLAEISRLFGKPIASLNEVTIPSNDCEAYRSYHHFVNESLSTLLAHGRAAWPRLAMQVRVDYDRMHLGEENVWLENDARTTDWGMRVTYFFPAMYAQSHETLLPAAQVLANLERMLLRVTDNGRNTRHLLDQFIFHDESPQFASWTKVRPEEMGEYLVGAGKLLRRYSRGFAFWNYFDYRVNHLYNTAFLRGLLGWKARGEVRVLPDGEPRFVSLAPGAALTQTMEPDKVGWGTPHYETMRFSAMARAPAGPGRLRLTSHGATEAQIAVHGDGKLEAAFPAERHRAGRVEFAIENTGTTPLEITDVCLWGFVYRARIYDEDGNPGTHLEAVRAMLRA